ESTQGIFFGTPHAGSDTAAFGKTMGRFLHLLTQGFGHSVGTDFLRHLTNDSEILVDISKSFRDISGSFMIVTIFELCALKIGKLPTGHVVSPYLVPHFASLFVISDH